MIETELTPTHLMVRAFKPGPVPNCMNCEGEGYLGISNGEKIDCPTCNGTGLLPKDAISIGLSLKRIGEALAKMDEDQLQQVMDAHDVYQDSLEARLRHLP